MKMKNLRTIMLTGLCAAIALSPTVNAGVYVSVDSIRPTTDHQLAVAQIEASKAQTKAIERSAMTSEFVLGQMLEWQQAQQRRADQKYDETMRQRLAVELKQEDLLVQQKRLMADKNSLEYERIAMLDDFHEQEQQMHKRNVATQRAIYDEQRNREESFYNTQADIQRQTLELQNKVASSSDDLLLAQLQHNAPSNIVVASKDAPNFKATLKPNDGGDLSALSRADSKAPLVNMNSFIESIMPDGWVYTPPANSSSKQISLVQGKDWKSIINQIAIQHPYLEFHIDPYKKTLVSRQMYQPQSPKQNDYIVRSWHIQKNKSLHETLDGFAHQAGWTLLWETENIDYPIVAPAVINTDFSGENGIVNQLMRSTQDQDFPLFAKWNNHNKVVVIKRRKSTRR
ncbi:TcpQ domain-containing protein [Vibrio agarivorans]|uniref:TcpQ domain-containing protein n=1 Tax=Vibrio agarivorans TaxID=153622 RepID=UPI0025B35C5D|nr:TcpQ domain-containing protein [Vibrio agarivorans]MDN3661080.1 TcpQ domain-containing protein [Vibrio agarivorans]